MNLIIMEGIGEINEEKSMDDDASTSPTLERCHINPHKFAKNTAKLPTKAMTALCYKYGYNLK
jgi:hypothetical protein